MAQQNEGKRALGALLVMALDTMSGFPEFGCQRRVRDAIGAIVSSYEPDAPMWQRTRALEACDVATLRRASVAALEVATAEIDAMPAERRALVPAYHLFFQIRDAVRTAQEDSHG